MGEKSDLAAHQHLLKSPKGVLKLNAPVETGGYRVRMYDKATDGKEVKSAGLNVDAYQHPALGLDDEEYTPGAQIKVRYWINEPFRELASVAIVPSETETGEKQFENALSHQGTAGEALGELIFLAPEKPGSYDARLKWSGEANGESMSGTAIVSFVVK